MLKKFVKTLDALLDYIPSRKYIKEYELVKRNLSSESSLNDLSRYYSGLKDIQYKIPRCYLMNVNSLIAEIEKYQIRARNEQYQQDAQ